MNDKTTRKMRNGPNILCPGCGRINNRLYPFCDGCAESFGGPSTNGKQMTASAQAYLEWRRQRDESNGR